MQRFTYGLFVTVLVGLGACGSPTGGNLPIDKDVAADDVPAMDVATDTTTTQDVASDAPAESAVDVPAMDATGPDVPADAAPEATPDVAPADTSITDGLACPSPEINCAGACINVQTDARNCGACGNACGAGQVCTAGACATPCPTGERLCGGRCINVQSDAANCGACGNACLAGQMCAMAACVTSCPTGQTVCGATMGRPGTCADLNGDPANCGMCGRACASGQACAMGVCGCPTGQAMCGSSCVDTLRDNAHCGACGRACAPAQTCILATCSCPVGQTLCGSSCVNLMSDAANCGRCANVCPSGSLCASAECRLPAPANDDCERPTAVDIAGGVTTTVTGSTRGATDSANTCGSGADVFYRITLTQREVVYVDTFGTSWNTLLGIQRPGCGAPAAFCTDDSCGGSQTQIARVLDPGSYFIVLDQADTTGGDFTLRIQHFPAGDGTAEALDLTPGTRRYAGALLGAGTVASACCSSGPENIYFGTTCPAFTEIGFRASTCGLATYNTSVDMRSANRTTAGGSICNDDACGAQSTAAGRIPAGAGLHVVYVDSCGTPPAGARYSIDFQVGDCPGGQSLCGGTCKDVSTSPSNCGACGVACSVGQACVSGRCNTTTGYSFTRGTLPFVDACGTPGVTRLLSNVDDVVGAVQTLPFTFRFFGVAYTQIRPTSNGYFIFGATSDSRDNAYYPSSALPSTSRPRPAAFVFNSDLWMRGAGGVCVATVGSSPSRRTVVEWLDGSICCGDTQPHHYTFEAALNEVDGTMDFIYQRIDHGPSPFTGNYVIGVQNETATRGSTEEYRTGGPPTTVSSGMSFRVIPM